jgi:hypothetical protein
MTVFEGVVWYGQEATPRAESEESAGQAPEARFWYCPVAPAGTRRC